jgi:hypothetical protein
MAFTQGINFVTSGITAIVAARITTPASFDAWIQSGKSLDSNAASTLLGIATVYTSFKGVATGLNPAYGIAVTAGSLYNNLNQIESELQHFHS